MRKKHFKIVKAGKPYYVASGPSRSTKIGYLDPNDTIVVLFGGVSSYDGKPVNIILCSYGVVFVPQLEKLI